MVKSLGKIGLSEEGGTSHPRAYVHAGRCGGVVVGGKACHLRIE